MEISLVESIRLLPLSDLKTDNVNEIFTKNFNNWKVIASGEVIINGKNLDDFDKAVLVLFGRNFDKDNPNIKTFSLSDTTKGGFPLTVDTFINEELRKYEPIYTKTIGSNSNRDVNLKLKIYIEFLKSYKTGTKKTPAKVGRPKVEIKPAHSYLKFEKKSSELFLEKFKEKFPISEPKQLAYLIITLSDFDYLEVRHQKAVFHSFAEFFKGNCGTFSGFNAHWKNRHNKKDTQLHYDTKENIRLIKHQNTII